MKKSLSFWANFGTTTISLIGIIVIINWLSTKYFKLFDLTEEKIHTLSDQTLKILEELDKKSNETKNKLEIIAFYREGDELTRKMENLLKIYEHKSKNIKWRIIDPEKKPQEAARYGIESVGVSILKFGERNIRISEASEKAISDGILKLVGGKPTKVCFSEGHGEWDPNDTTQNGISNFAKYLRQEGYEVGKIRTWEEGSLSQCEVLIIAGAKRKFTDAEISKIYEWIILGGRAFFLMEPNSEDNLQNILERFGIGGDGAIIIDLTSRMVGGDPTMPIAVEYDKESEITKNFNFATIYYLAKHIFIEKKVEGVDTKEIAKTSGQSWAEYDWKSGEVKFEEGKDKRGPLPLIITAEGVPGTKSGEITYGTYQNPVTVKPRIVVTADSDSITNKLLDLFGNKDMALNLVNWLSYKGELISIRPKERKQRSFVLTPKRARNMFIISVVGIPILFLMGSIITYIRKKKL